MHNNSMGATTARAEAAAAAQGTNLEAALAEQHAAQLVRRCIPCQEVVPRALTHTCPARWASAFDAPAMLHSSFKACPGPAQRALDRWPP